jgi:hypothetical protein
VGLTVSPRWFCYMCCGSGGVCDQKTSKFFVSHVEEFMAGHVDVNGVY